MRNAVPLEVLAAPFTMYVAPVGTVFPEVDQEPDSTDWTLVGAAVPAIHRRDERVRDRAAPAGALDRDAAAAAPRGFGPLGAKVDERDPFRVRVQPGAEPLRRRELDPDPLADGALLDANVAGDHAHHRDVRRGDRPIEGPHLRDGCFRAELRDRGRCRRREPNHHPHDLGILRYAI